MSISRHDLQAITACAAAVAPGFVQGLSCLASRTCGRLTTFSGLSGPLPSCRRREKISARITSSTRAERLTRAKSWV